MPRRQRDYAAEYRRRLARALERGLSRSQARGHPRAGERHVSPKARRWTDLKLLEGLKALRDTGSLSKAAETAKVAPERLRSFVRQLDFVEKRRSRYAVGEDPWERRVIFLANGRTVDTTVRGFEMARVVGSHWNALKKFVETNDRAYLAPFIGKKIIDANGRKYTLETRPNVIYRIYNETTNPFEQVYRINI